MKLFKEKQRLAFWGKIFRENIVILLKDAMKYREEGRGSKECQDKDNAKVSKAGGGKFN